MDCQCLTPVYPGVLLSGMVLHAGIPSIAQATPRTLLKEEGGGEPQPPENSLCRTSYRMNRPRGTGPLSKGSGLPCGFRTWTRGQAQVLVPCTGHTSSLSEK